MHIVHQSAETPDKSVEAKHPIGKLAVVGIIFDQKNHDKVSDKTVEAIDKFFDSLMMH